jgi:hypothetical protein
MTQRLRTPKFGGTRSKLELCPVAVCPLSSKVFASEPRAALEAAVGNNDNAEPVGSVLRRRLNLSVYDMHRRQKVFFAQAARSTESAPVG